MIINAYSIYDRKALVYNQPFYAHTHGAAARMLSDLVNDANSMVSRHPDDYVMYHVGAYDDQTGAFLPLAPIAHIMDATSVVALKPSN